MFRWLPVVSRPHIQLKFYNSKKKIRVLELWWQHDHNITWKWILLCFLKWNFIQFVRVVVIQYFALFSIPYSGKSSIYKAEKDTNLINKVDTRNTAHVGKHEVLAWHKPKLCAFFCQKTWEQLYWKTWQPSLDLSRDFNTCSLDAQMFFFFHYNW